MYTILQASILKHNKFVNLRINSSSLIMLITLANGGQSIGVCILKLLEDLLLGFWRHEELGELTIDGEY